MSRCMETSPLWLELLVFAFNRMTVCMRLTLRAGQPSPTITLTYTKLYLY